MSNVDDLFYEDDTSGKNIELINKSKILNNYLEDFLDGCSDLDKHIDIISIKKSLCKDKIANVELIASTYDGEEFITNTEIIELVQYGNKWIINVNLALYP